MFSSCFTFFTLFVIRSCHVTCILFFTCCAFFVLHSFQFCYFHSALSSCSTLFMLHFFHVDLLIMHSFHFSLFSCCTIFMLHLCSYCTRFMPHFFHVAFFRDALFPRCFFILHSFHVALYLSFLVMGDFFSNMLSLENFGVIASFSCAI